MAGEEAKLSLYEFLLWIHITSAVLWVGGSVMILILALKMRAASDENSLMRVGQLGELLGKTFFMPLAIVQLLSGIFLVLEGDIGFDNFWILGGIVGIVGSSIIGAAFLTPLSGKLAAAMAEKGFGSGEVQAALDRIFLLNKIDVAILLLIVFLMSVKPGY